MSTSADIRRPGRKPIPVYKRKRRLIYGSVAAAVAVIVAVAVVVAVTQGGEPRRPGSPSPTGRGTS